LAEIDPGGDAMGCFGITAETQAIAHRVSAAVRMTARNVQPPVPVGRPLALPA
jgi:hypothetical protein